MPAWEHSTTWGWNSKTYYMYRKYVMANAKALEKSDQDCADLSIQLLVYFAEDKKLCLTIRDAVGGMYISKAPGLIRGSARDYELDDDITWSTKDEYLNWV